MALLFFISGLFVGPSLAAKGPGGFARSRAWRLGWPLVLGWLLVMPPTFYVVMRAGGSHPDLSRYMGVLFPQSTVTLGPLWFLLVLMAFDLAAAALFRLVPAFVDTLAGATSGAARRPLRFCFAVVVLGTAGYFSLLKIFGPLWVTVWHLSLQYSRLLLYGIFFFAGIAVGARGVERGMLGRESQLVRRWPLWLSGAVTAQVLYVSYLSLGDRIVGLVGPFLAALAYSLVFVLTCATSGFGLLAAFQRFARPSAILDSLSANSFGIFVVHYFFVFWVQYLLLDWNLPGTVKATLVFACALPLSWACAALLRQLPSLFERRVAATPNAPRSRTDGSSQAGQ